MKYPLTTHLGTKIINYLTLKEGYIKQDSQIENSRLQITMQDSMGFLYDITIRPIGRVGTGNSFDPGVALKITKEII